MSSLSIEDIPPVVQGRAVDVLVTFHNEAQLPAIGMVVALRPQGPGLSVAPDPDLGNYVIQKKVPPGSSIQVPFTVSAVDVDAGRSVDMLADAKVYFASQDREELVENFVSPVKSLAVQARPEIYAAIGAADAIRDGLKYLYTEAKKRGLESEEKYRTHLPGGRQSEPLDVALGEQAFRWALNMVELGTRLYRVQADETEKAAEAAATQTKESSNQA